jgi:CubicO group peptidase (beta-lactamase class C family)
MLANRGELNGVRLLKQSTVKTMTTNQLSGSAFPVRFGNEPWQGMGFGLGIGVQVIDPIQFGWIGLSGTSAWIFPREDMIVIAMPQALGYGEAGDMLLKMAREAIMI